MSQQSHGDAAEVGKLGDEQDKYVEEPVMIVCFKLLNHFYL